MDRTLFKTLKLKPVNIDEKILAMLERRDLVRTLKFTKRVLRVKPGRAVVEKIYSSSPGFGSHKLICVGKNDTRITLTIHPDNEEFIIINNERRSFKPLYLIVGLHKYREIERRAKKGTLCARDVAAIRLRYNDPRTSVFTMLKNTPHCEVTVPGKKANPAFFVTEPSRFKMSRVNLSGYKFVLR